MEERRPPEPPRRTALDRVMTRLGLGALHIHQAIYEVSDGRVGHRMLGVPCLLLRTTGRRTGKSRTSALVYARDGEDYVVVGSLGGSDRAPGWLHNVRAQPEVRVQVGRNAFPAVATVIQPGEDAYDRLWRLVNDNNGGRYDRYQAKTQRPIPIVRLTRLQGGSNIRLSIGWWTRRAPASFTMPSAQLAELPPVPEARRSPCPAGWMELASEARVT